MEDIRKKGINVRESMETFVLEELGDKREAVASRLERVREILGLSKKEFAGRAGMSEQAYGAFENGQRELSLIAARKLRVTYNLSLEFMYLGKIDDLTTRISKEL